MAMGTVVRVRVRSSSLLAYQNTMTRNPENSISQQAQVTRELYNPGSRFVQSRQHRRIQGSRGYAHERHTHGLHGVSRTRGCDSRPPGPRPLEPGPLEIEGVWLRGGLRASRLPHIQPLGGDDIPDMQCVTPCLQACCCARHLTCAWSAPGLVYSPKASEKRGSWLSKERLYPKPQDQPPMPAPSSLQARAADIETNIASFALRRLASCWPR